MVPATPPSVSVMLTLPEVPAAAPVTAMILGRSSATARGDVGVSRRIGGDQSRSAQSRCGEVQAAAIDCVAIASSIPSLPQRCLEVRSRSKCLKYCRTTTEATAESSAIVVNEDQVDTAIATGRTAAAPPARAVTVKPAAVSCRM